MHPDYELMYHQLSTELYHLKLEHAKLKIKEKRFRLFWKWCKKRNNDVVKDYHLYLKMLSRFDCVIEDAE